MFLLSILFGGLAALSGITIVVCFVIVIIQMFGHDEFTLAIICIGLTLCTGVGVLITFVFGWIKAKDWYIQNVMLIWTAAYAVLVLSGLLLGWVTRAG